jgi:sorting nexin-4
MYIKASRLEADFVEPMQSQTRMAQMVKQVIEFQYLKQCQVELIELTLDRRRHELDSLLQMEEELQRSDHVYEPPPLDSADKISPSSKQTNRPPSASFAARLLNSASYSLQAMIDVDPASTRRNHVAKSKEALQIVSILLPPHTFFTDPASLVWRSLKRLFLFVETTSIS